MKSELGPKSPPSITSEKLALLKVNLAKSIPKTIAARLSGVSYPTLRRYELAHPEFEQEIKFLQESPTLKARLNVVDAIDNGNIGVSQWWLERKLPEEFGKKDTTTTNIQINEIRDWDETQRRQMLAEAEKSG